MPSIAKSPLAPVLGKHVPLRGPARLLYNSYARTRYLPQQSVTRVTTATGDVFDADDRVRERSPLRANYLAVTGETAARLEGLQGHGR